jgi:hypothetical protein
MLCKESIILDRIAEATYFSSEIVNFLKLHNCRFCDISIVGSIKVELDWAWVCVVFRDPPFFDECFEILKLV